MFPSNIIANFFRFEQARYFEIYLAEETVPKVSFSAEESVKPVSNDDLKE